MDITKGKWGTTAGNPPYPWHKKDCMLFSIAEHPHCTCGFDDAQAKMNQPKYLQFHSMDGGTHKVEIPEMDSKEYKLQKQVDLLTLGLLQEKNRSSELLAACKVGLASFLAAKKAFAKTADLLKSPLGVEMLSTHEDITSFLVNAIAKGTK